MRTGRRALVLIDEAARHPFRRSLPPHIRKQVVEVVPRHGWLRRGLERWKGFLAAYCAAFVVVSIFIA